MRILICSTSGALGGMERRIEAEVQLLTRLGHDVLVASTKFKGLENWKSDITDAGATYIDWRPYKFIEREQYAAPVQWLARASARRIQRERIDLAHIAIPWNYVGMSMAYVLQSVNVPFIFSAHCKFGRRALAKPGQEAVTKAMGGCVGGYAVSKPVADSVYRLYAGMIPKSLQLDTILNGIDTARFRPDKTKRHTMRQKLKFQDDHFVVIFCGRLDPMKRPLFALRAFAKFSLKHSASRLLIVGDGSERKALEAEIASIGLQERVTFVGQVADTSQYYSASDCYLSTSANQEGCPLAAAEALASGLPAILPDDDVFRSVYGHCKSVRLCSLDDLEDWENGLSSIASLDARLMQSLQQVGQEFVTAELSQEIMNTKLTSFYERLFSNLGFKR